MDKKRNKRKMQNEDVKSYGVLIAVLCVCVAALIIALVVKNNSDSKKETSDSSASSAATQTQANEQVYNAVNDMVMDKDTKEVALDITNDPDNSYNLKVTVELDGAVLYESDLISPGKTLGTVTFDTDIETGEYSVMVSLDSYSSSDGELVNGVIYTRTLTVE